MVSRKLIDFLRRHYRLDWSGVHGVAHWARVDANGLKLSEKTGANVKVVRYFAFLHDSCRHDDDRDPAHGHRAAELAIQIRRTHIDLEDLEFECLLAALSGHTHGTAHEDVTVATCWDADRLDLARVGIEPDPERLLLPQARCSEMIRTASDAARYWLEAYCRREK